MLFTLISQDLSFVSKLHDAADQARLAQPTSNIRSQVRHPRPKGTLAWTTNVVQSIFRKPSGASRSGRIRSLAGDPSSPARRRKRLNSPAVLDRPFGKSAADGAPEFVLARHNDNRSSHRRGADPHTMMQVISSYLIRLVRR